MTEPGQADFTLVGERARAPRGPVGTVLSCVTGLLFVEGAIRLFARAALGYRRPASVVLDQAGLVISDETRLLGRTLSERRTVVPAANVAQVERETRFARLGLFVGLFALGLGTYVGVGLVADGVRVPGGSPSLLGLGALFIVLGVLLDYGISLLDARLRGTCRLVVHRRTGAPLCLTGLEPGRVDALLSELRRTLEEPSPTTELSAPAPTATG